MDNRISTYITYPLTGATNFDIPFQYLARKFIVVTARNSDGSLVLTMGNQYRFSSQNTITLNVSLAGFTELEIRRVTSTTPIVSFQDGSVLTAGDLTVSELQAIHIAEEARDQSLDIVEGYVERAEDAAQRAEDAANLVEIEAKGLRVKAEKVDYTRDGTTRSLTDKLREYVSITDFGGKGDGTFDNGPALLKACEAVAFKGTIHFPLAAGDHYVFSNIFAWWTDQVEFVVESGIRFTVPSAGYLGNGLRWNRQVKVAFTDGAEFIYGSSAVQSAGDRPMWLDIDNADSSRYEAVNIANEVSFYEWDQRTDDFNTIVVSKSQSAWVTDVSDLYKVRVGILGATVGDSLSFVGDSASLTSTSVLGCVVASDERQWFWSGGSADFNTPAIARKAVGQNVTVEDILYQGINTHPAYAMYKSVVTIRIDTLRSYTVFFNGFAVAHKTTSSDITGFGCGAQGIGQLTLKDMVVSRGAPKNTGEFLNVACWGDSLSGSSMPTTWVHYMENILDASNGIRFQLVDNYAVPGQSSSDQVLIMRNTDVGKYNYHVIMIGTNDIQGQAAVATYISNVREMIDTCLNRGAKVILGVPPMWYTREQLPNGGGGSVNADKGRLHRSALMRLVASYTSPRVQLVDMMPVTGPVLADFRSVALNPELANKGRDAGVYDTLHLTQNSQMLIARAFSKKVMGMCAPVDVGHKGADQGGEFLVGSIARNGYTVDGQSKYFRNGRLTTIMLTLSTPTTVENAKVIAVLPRAARPSMNGQYVVPGNGENIRVTIDRTGDITVYGLNTPGNIQMCVTFPN